MVLLRVVWYDTTMNPLLQMLQGVSATPGMSYGSAQPEKLQPLFSEEPRPRPQQLQPMSEEEIQAMLGTVLAPKKNQPFGEGKGGDPRGYNHPILGYGANREPGESKPFAEMPRGWDTNATFGPSTAPWAFDQRLAGEGKDIGPYGGNPLLRALGEGK